MRNGYQLLAFLILLSGWNGFSQEEVRGDEDASGFFTVNGTLMSNQYNSTGEIFEDAKPQFAYEFGVAYYLTNEINYDMFFVRFSLDYAKEKTEAGTPINYQNIEVISKGDFSLLGLSMFGAYRFDPQSKINAYLGGGIFAQVRLNSDDDAFRFVTSTGEEFPIFVPDDVNAPIRYRRTGPDRIILGFIAETGSFIWLGKRWLTVGLGINYGFFPRVSASQSIGKSNLYLKLGYEIF
jgi:hypothetical protein